MSLPETSNNTTSQTRSHGLRAFAEKNGFHSKNQIIGFLTVVLSGQLIYSSFEAFKGAFYDLLLKVLGLNNAQLGVIFSLIGISIFFYLPGGWLNNRFSVKSLLIAGIAVRFVGVMVIIFMKPSFNILRIIAISWGLVDSFFWPAVLHGVELLTDKKHRGMAFGLLESIRRALEMVMNLLIVGLMTLFGGISVFKTGMLAYNLLLIPLVFFIIKYVPNNGIAAENTSEAEKSSDALKGLLHIFTLPKVWLASISALTIYWNYVNLIYTVPYLQAVFHISQTQASIFGIFNTDAMGVIGGLVSGTLADYLFHSSSKMIFSALIMTFLSLLAVLMIPKSKNYLWLSIVLLVVFAFSTFLAKSIIFAPIDEANVPKRYYGSAMSVGSFVGYAPIFWVYSMNGKIIDIDKPIAAYQHIFMIGAIVAAVGIVSSFILMKMIDKSEKNDSKA